MKLDLDMDINILLSLINTKLRNDYDSLESLCCDLEINEDELIDKLKKIDYIYSKASNQFVHK